MSNGFSDCKIRSNSSYSVSWPIEVYLSSRVWRYWCSCLEHHQFMSPAIARWSSFSDCLYKVLRCGLMEGEVERRRLGEALFSGWSEPCPPNRAAKAPRSNAQQLVIVVASHRRKTISTNVHSSSSSTDHHSTATSLRKRPPLSFSSAIWLRTIRFDYPDDARP